VDLGLQERVAFVTGGSRGIGKAVALAYAREGARVAISYHSNLGQAEGTAEEISRSGGEPLVVRLDLGDFESALTAVQEIVKAWGGIDCFVASAVRWPDVLPDPNRKFEDTPAAEWQTMLRGNIEGTIATLQAVLPAMRDRSDGRIVLISSDIARNGNIGSAFYGASKAALQGIAASMVAELKGDILVNIVVPGFTTTERNVKNAPEHIRAAQAAKTPTGRLSAPDDIANAVVFLGSPANGNITRGVLNVTGGH
jgi:NAD(P)-dependent dehydrogenase (short-subunit alcohol dehydrogenase family)